MTIAFSRRLRFCRLAALAALLASQAWLPADAQTMSSAGRSALLIDAETGTTLFAKEPDLPLPPASMSKLMTVEVAFRAVKEGRLSLEDRFPISRKANRMGGSRMFLREGDSVRVEDLLRGIIILSGNDACVALAEGMSGSEEAFARLLNLRARELGLSNSRFANASGWPHPDHVMSADDIAAVSLHLVREYPDLYPMFSETEFEWEGIRQNNRNPLLYRDVGADGLKTGHTEESGYSLAATAVRGGRRLLLVVTGLETARQRADEAERLIFWGFREFETGVLFGAEETLAEAKVWLGKQARVRVGLAEPLVATVPRSSSARRRAVLRYEEPVPAPIALGRKVGELTLETQGDEVRVPLVALEDVAAGGLLVRAGSLIEALLTSGDDE